MSRLLLTSTFSAVICAFGLLGPATAQDVKISVDEFHVTEGGSFGEVFLNNIGTNEFATIATAVCAAFEEDCSAEAAEVARGARSLHTLMTGTDFAISGHIDKQAGEEWWVMFLAPEGYSVCRATNSNGKMSITGPSTFNASIIRDRPEHNGLGIYAVIPKNRDTRQWVDAYLSIMYVPAGTEAAHHCWPTNQVAWTCKGQDCHYIDGASK
ncbi:MAG: hypothetical protein JO228_01970 [Xanthobacteraceae bacterium]|nr:hypothetical protein [Xanthobacteraceae bacterium]